MTRAFLDGRELHTVANRTWFLDPRQMIDSAILAGAWEGQTTNAILKLVKPGMVALDVGANIGWYTVILSELVGPSGRVMAFEPMAEPASLIQKHIDLNNIENAAIHRIALGDSNREDESGFFNYSWARLPKTDLVKQLRNKVIHRTLDGLQADLNFDRVDFIKIDVDGYEAKMLRGSHQILETYHPSMLLEVCDYTLRGVANKSPAPKCHPEYGEESQAMLENLVKLDYRFYRENTGAELSIPEILNMVDLSATSANIVVKT